MERERISLFQEEDAVPLPALDTARDARSDKESASADEPVPMHAAMDRAEDEEQGERRRFPA